MQSNIQHWSGTKQALPFTIRHRNVIRYSEKHAKFALKSWNRLLRQHKKKVMYNDYNTSNWLVHQKNNHACMPGHKVLQKHQNCPWHIWNMSRRLHWTLLRKLEGYSHLRNKPLHLAWCILVNSAFGWLTAETKHSCIYWCWNWHAKIPKVTSKKILGIFKAFSDVFI